MRNLSDFVHFILNKNRFFISFTIQLPYLDKKFVTLWPVSET